MNLTGWMEPEVDLYMNLRGGGGRGGPLPEESKLQVKTSIGAS